MKLNPNVVQPQEQEEPILHLGKKLLPIDEYSLATGLSKGLLEQYGRIGIVQTRRYKGKTFVVDVASSPRFDNAETKAVEELLNSRNRVAQTKKLTDLVTKMTSSPKVKAPLPQQIPDLQLFKGLAAPQAISKTVATGRSGLRRIFVKIQTSQLQQVLVVFAATFIIVSLYASFWLLITGKVQAGKFARANTGIQEIIGESAMTEQKIEGVQNQLSNSISQANILRTEIAAATGELKTIQRSNERAVQQLEEQFAKFKLSE